jgi:hypothetical protein
MGKHIIRLSRRSTRSLYQFYSRLLTLIFALFCSVTGQIQKSASSKQGNTTTFKGSAYIEAGSGVLKNVKLYLHNVILVKYGVIKDDGIMPEYGVSAWYGVNTGNNRNTANEKNVSALATFETDENGNFETEIPDPATGTGSYYISSDEVVTPGGKVTYYSSENLTIKAGVDTSYTLYFVSAETSTKPSLKETRHQFTVTAISGKDFLFQIPEWKGQKISAAIINSKGQQVTKLCSDATGTLCWKTGSIVGGVYFLKLQNGQNNLFMKILVK